MGFGIDANCSGSPHGGNGLGHLEFVGIYFFYDRNGTFAIGTVSPLFDRIKHDAIDTIANRNCRHYLSGLRIENDHQFIGYRKKPVIDEVNG